MYVTFFEASISVTMGKVMFDRQTRLPINIPLQLLVILVS